MQIADALTEVETKLGAEHLAAIKVHLGTLNEEAKNHRLAKESVETQLKTILTGLGAKEGETADQLAARLKAEREQLAGSATSSKTELQLAMERITALETGLTEWKGKAESEAKARVEQETTLAVSEALQKAGAASDSIAILTEVIRKAVAKGEKGYSFTGADGKAVDLQDGVKQWLEQNPRFRADNQHGGSGGGGSATGGKMSAGDAYAQGDATAGTTILLRELRNKRS